MKISILISSNNHPINPYIREWTKEKNSNHIIDIFNCSNEIIGGDILFLISCEEIIPKIIRDKFKKTLIIHASDLPFGRGWNPHIWEIINGASEITFSLLEAEDNVDSGDIWTKSKVFIPKTALYDEINYLIFEEEIRLMNFAISNFNNIKPVRQDTRGSSYWPKRTPKDSEIDPNKNLADQFDLIRVCDVNRFPAFFYKNGQKYKISISQLPIDK